MATLALEGVNERIVSAYAHASQETKQQLNKVIEDVLQMWTQHLSEEAHEEKCWQDFQEFLLSMPTFPLNWQRQKMTREEMNTR